MALARNYPAAAPLSIREHLKHYYVATFLNTFTPANLGETRTAFWHCVPRRRNKPGRRRIVREHLIGLLTYLCAAPFLLALAYLQEAPIDARLTGVLDFACLAAIVAAAILLFAPRLMSKRLLQLAFVERRAWTRTVARIAHEGLRLPSWPELAILFAFRYWRSRCGSAP